MRHTVTCELTMIGTWLCDWIALECVYDTLIDYSLGRVAS